MESKDSKKQSYSPPTLTKLTPEQAERLVPDRNLHNEEEAAGFFKLAPTPRPQSDGSDQE
jgi:hypothetical protein